MKNAKQLAAILLIIGATFAAYFPSLKNEFVWDDTALVLRDPLIRSWQLIPESFRHFLFLDATASNFYRPIQRLSYTFDYALHAFQPCGYHLTNIAIHAAAVVMLFLLAQGLISKFDEKNAVLRARQIILPLLVALIWAVHPVHSSAVCYIAGRADLLAAFFSFGGLLIVLRGGKSAAETVGGSACFLGAILSKEIGVVALGICLAMLMIRRDRAALKRWAICAMLVLAVYSALRFSAEKIEPPRSQTFSVAVRPLLMGRALAEYAGLLIAPVNLHMERDLVPLDRGDLHATVEAALRREFQTILGFVLLTAFVLWCRWARRKARLVFFSLIAFAISYLPVSNLFPLNATAAEHWLYLPSPFLFLGCGVVIARFSRQHVLVGALIGVAIVALAARTFTQNNYWKNDHTFFESTIRAGGDSSRMFIGLGLIESRDGNYPQALQNFREALKRSPNDPFAMIGLAGVYVRSGEYQLARNLLERTQSLPFFRAQSLEMLATLEYKETKADRVDLLREAAQLSPKNWPIQKRYLTHLDERGDPVEAIRELRALLEREPFRAESWHLLGDLLLKINQPDLARAAFANAASRDVHDDKARAYLSLR